MCTGNQPENNAPVIEPDFREYGRSIYVIGPKEGPFKIGIADDVGKRRGQLNVGNPLPLHIHNTFQADDEEQASLIEHELHFTFRAKHIRGEWFNLTKEEVANFEASARGCRQFPCRPDGWNLERKVASEFTPDLCRIAREWLGLTQQKLADAAQLSVQTIINFETAKTTPQQETLELIRDALKERGASFQRQDDGSWKMVLPERAPN
jgi:DNA-binding XRE family transcriptional regulator